MTSMTMETDRYERGKKVSDSTCYGDGNRDRLAERKDKIYIQYMHNYVCQYMTFFLCLLKRDVNYHLKV